MLLKSVGTKFLMTGCNLKTALLRYCLHSIQHVITDPYMTISNISTPVISCKLMPSFQGTCFVSSVVLITTHTCARGKRDRVCHLLLLLLLFVICCAHKNHQILISIGYIVSGKCHKDVRVVNITHLLLLPGR